MVGSAAAGPGGTTNPTSSRQLADTNQRGQTERRGMPSPPRSAENGRVRYAAGLVPSMGGAGARTTVYDDAVIRPSSGRPPAVSERRQQCTPFGCGANQEERAS